MKPNTRNNLTIAAAAVAIITAGAAFAADGVTPFSMGPGMMSNRMGPGIGPGMMGANPVTYTDQQLTQLKTRLGITPQQKTIWNVYVDAMKARAGLMLAHRNAMLGGATITPDQRTALHQQGFAQMQRVASATHNLYAALTPEQQRNAGGPAGLGCWIR